MSTNLRRIRQGLRDAASTWGLAIVVIGIAFVFTYQFVEPAPPKRITMATGAAGGAYQIYGEQFAAYLAQEGIEIALVESAGAVENLQLLDSDQGVDLAFVQGGLADLVPTENVVAVGSLYWEPLWLFVHGQDEINGVGDLVGKRIAVGEEGSGTRAVVLNLLAEHGINAQTAVFLSSSVSRAFDRAVWTERPPMSVVIPIFQRLVCRAVLWIYRPTFRLLISIRWP